MNYNMILKKGKSLLVWFYKNFTDKFTNGFKFLKGKFPIIDKYPLLKYSLIPLLLALFFALRYLIKFVVNELAAYTTSFVGETMGYSVSEKTVLLSIVAVFIIFRIVVKLHTQEKEKIEQTEVVE